nr:MAG TPA: hypothetical protein [Caudoviricetes sp.]
MSLISSPPTASFERRLVSLRDWTWSRSSTSGPRLLLLSQAHSWE